MMLQRAIRSSLLLAGGAVTAAMLAACQGQFSASGSVTTNSAAAPASATVSGAVSPDSGSGGTQDSSSGGTQDTKSGSTQGKLGQNTTGKPAGRTYTTPECKAAQLKTSIGQGDQGAGAATYPIVFTNSGGTPCVLDGYPGVSFVAGDNGQQIGAPATRVPPMGPQVTLAPGQTAYAAVREAVTDNFPADTCRPVQVRGLRVYAPDDTAAIFVPFNSTQQRTECSSPSASQLSVQTVKPGDGNMQ